MNHGTQASPRPITKGEVPRPQLKTPLAPWALPSSDAELTMVHGSENHLFTTLHSVSRAAYPEQSKVEHIPHDQVVLASRWPGSSSIVRMSLSRSGRWRAMECRWRSAPAGIEVVAALCAGWLVVPAVPMG